MLFWPVACMGTGTRLTAVGSAKGGDVTHQITPEMRDCIANCTECHNSCTETAQHSLGLGGPHADPHYIHVLLDCAQMCATSADFMLRGSELHGRVCGICAEACDRCAEECERLANGDETITRCAQICRRCAESCRRMAA
jgi:hypothetical protein